MAWQLLFSSEQGLVSLFVIAFVVAMAVWFSRFFLRKMDEDEKTADGARTSSAGRATTRRH